MTTDRIYWLLLGLILAAILLICARSRSRKAESNILGIALIVAAAIYAGFALVQGDLEWMLIELAGIPLYGLFYWFSRHHSLNWLAAGWALHPLWDAALHLKGAGLSIAPEWYPTACISFDLLVAAYIVLSQRSKHAFEEAN